MMRIELNGAVAGRFGFCKAPEAAFARREVVAKTGVVRRDSTALRYSAFARSYLQARMRQTRARLYASAVPGGMVSARAITVSASSRSPSRNRIVASSPCVAEHTRGLCYRVARERQRLRGTSRAEEFVRLNVRS